jgi:hypothetical protein
MRTRNRRFWAEEQLILLSVGTAARRQAMRERAAELAALVDWSLVAELLRVRRLLPLLGPRVIELVDHVGVDDEFAVVVNRAVEAACRQGAALQLVEERVRAVLADSGIVSMTLKGSRLSEALYGDPGRRMSSDIDLLVAGDQLYNAVEAVRTLGYGSPSDHVEDDGLPRLHFALIHERNQLPPVELHWRMHWYEGRFAEERLLPPKGAQVDVWWPAPGDELTALLLFYARDGFSNLRLATDLGAWWDTFGTQLQLGAIDELIQSYPALEHVLLVAVRVAERVVGLPAAQLTRQRSKLGARDRIALQLADPYPRSSDAQLYADIGLIDGLLMPRGSFRAFVRRQVFPPRDVLYEHARRSRKNRATSSVGHGARVLARYALAMARLVRPGDSRYSRAG